MAGSGPPTEKGRDGAPGHLIFRRQPHAVRRKSHKGAVENDRAACAELLERDGEGGGLQPRLCQKPQFLPANPLKVGILGMIGRELLDKHGGEYLPAIRRDGDPRCRGLEEPIPV